MMFFFLAALFIVVFFFSLIVSVRSWKPIPPIAFLSFSVFFSAWVEKWGSASSGLGGLFCFCLLFLASSIEYAPVHYEIMYLVIPHIVRPIAS